MPEVAQHAYDAYAAHLTAWWKDAMQQDGSVFHLTPWPQLRDDQQDAWRAAAAAVRQDLQDAE